MDKELIDELYGTMILEHSRNPRNFGKLSCSCQAKGKNPSCGDELVVFVEKREGKIFDIKFTGQGCALSVASTSLMTQAVKEKDLNYVSELLNKFINFILKNDELSDNYEPLHIFGGVKRFPLRVKCVLLPWRTLQSIMQETSNITTTE